MPIFRSLSRLRRLYVTVNKTVAAFQEIADLLMRSVKRPSSPNNLVLITHAFQALVLIHPGNVAEQHGHSGSPLRAASGNGIWQTRLVCGSVSGAVEIYLLEVFEGLGEFL
jgi:gentisate 1,2-dioxygenase